MRLPCLLFGGAKQSTTDILRLLITLHPLGLSSFLVFYTTFFALYVRAANTSAAGRIYVRCAK